MDGLRLGVRKAGLPPLVWETQFHLLGKCWFRVWLSLEILWFFVLLWCVHYSLASGAITPERYASFERLLDEARAEEAQRRPY